MGPPYLFCQVYSEQKHVVLTARNSLASVIFGLWWKRPLLPHNTADPDVRIFLNCAEVMESDEGERDTQC